MCPQWQAVHGYISVVSPWCSSYHPTQLLFAWLGHHHSCSGAPETCPWPPLLTQTLLSSPLKWYEPGSQRTVLKHLSSVSSARQEVQKHCFILLVYQTTSKSHGREGNEWEVKLNSKLLPFKSYPPWAKASCSPGLESAAALSSVVASPRSERQSYKESQKGYKHKADVHEDLWSNASYHPL